MGSRAGRLKGAVLAAAVASLAASCQDPNAERDRQTIAQAGVLRARTDGRMPANLPPYLALYPGARIVQTVDGGARGGTIAFTAQATPAQVAAFYRSRAAAAGLAQKTDVSSNDVRILMFDDAPAGRRNFVLNLTREGAAVQAALTYGPQG